MQYLMKCMFLVWSYAYSIDTPSMQLFNMNPNVRNMMESNTQLREMFQNPAFLRQLTSPETLQVINYSALVTCASCKYVEF